MVEKRTKDSLDDKTERLYDEKKDNAEPQNVWHFFVSAIGRSKGVTQDSLFSFPPSSR